MTTKADYTDDEWVRLRRAPFVAGLAISIADPGGPIELTKETMATLKGTASPPSQDELLVSVSRDIQSVVKQKQNPLAGFKSDSSALAGKMILDELGGGERHPRRQGDLGGGSRFPPMAPGGRRSSRGRREGGRLHGVRGRAGE